MKTLKFFAVQDLVKRLANAADANRDDQVTRVMHEIYEKKLEKGLAVKLSHYAELANLPFKAEIALDTFDLAPASPQFNFSLILL